MRNVKFWVGVEVTPPTRAVYATSNGFCLLNPLPTLDFGLWILDFGLWTLAFGVAWGGWRLTLELDFGLWILDLRILVPPPILDFGLWNLTLDFASSY